MCVAGNGIKSARGLTSLQSLKCLKACGLQWGLEDCQHLAILTDLQSLELPTNPVTDEGAGNQSPSHDDILADLHSALRVLFAVQHSFSSTGAGCCNRAPATCSVELCSSQPATLICCCSRCTLSTVKCLTLQAEFSLSTPCTCAEPCCLLCRDKSAGLLMH